MTKPPRGFGRWRPFASPLTRRILAVNLLAPVILVLGQIYLDRTRQELVRAELAGLATVGRMIAAAVDEGALLEGPPGVFTLNTEIVQPMIRRLAEPAHVRVRLFDGNGMLAADSHYLLSARGVFQIEELPPAGAAPGWFARHWDRIWSLDMKKTAGERLDKDGRHFPKVMDALGGEVGTAVMGGGRAMVLSAAVPVQRFKQVTGAVMVSVDGGNVARSLFEVRERILSVLAGVLLITVLVSLYLAGTIARPIRRLALAAERVRHGHGRRHAIPDMSARGDEIGELAVAFREMTEALWRRMDAIEAFAADVSHEIKNPLTSIHSAIETVVRIDDPVKQARLLAIVQQDVARLNRLLTDISDASRLDAELSRAEMKPVDLGAMIDALAEVFGTGPVHFHVRHPPGDVLIVPGIEDRLVQVLRNLIGNAQSFSPNGGTITLTAAPQGGSVRLTVEDEGPGIPPGKLDAVFERFYSERPDGEAFGTHSGLGLSISRQIVAAHGGTLTAENRAGGGARFVVTLPANP